MNGERDVRALANSGARKTFRRDTDNRHRLAFDQQRLPDDARISAEAASPIVV